MTLSQPQMNWISFFLLLALVATTTLAAPTVTTDDPQEIQVAKSSNDNLECGCCIAEFAFDGMVHCDGEDAHLFCTKCVTRAAEEQMGLRRRIELKCMSLYGCDGTFEHSQLIKALPPKIIDGWKKIETQECIRLAAAEEPNLVMCPFCDYAAVIDPPDFSDSSETSADVKWNNKEFRCVNEGCEIVSCRTCKRKSHLPLSCIECDEKEADMNKEKDFLDACHYIEEAKTKGLVRECKKCHRPFYKETDCNVVTCADPCSEKSCYVCGELVPDGYMDGHFKKRFGCRKGNEGDTDVPQNERKVNAAARKAAAKIPRRLRSLINERTPLLVPTRNVMERITDNVDTLRSQINQGVQQVAVTLDPVLSQINPCDVARNVGIVTCTVGGCVGGSFLGGSMCGPVGCGVLGYVAGACNGGCTIFPLAFCIFGSDLCFDC